MLKSAKSLARFSTGWLKSAAPGGDGAGTWGAGCGVWVRVVVYPWVGTRTGTGAPTMGTGMGTSHGYTAPALPALRGLAGASGCPCRPEGLGSLPSLVA